VTAANTIALTHTSTRRLNTANGNWGQSAFTYDATGNKAIDNNTVAGVTTARTATYPATSNRISAISQNGSGWRTYVHDGAGNITTDTRPGETFVTTYNKRNRPVSVTRNAGNSPFMYTDRDGRSRYHPLAGERDRPDTRGG
jgi:YD repeat-containing protein